MDAMAKALEMIRTATANAVQRTIDIEADVYTPERQWKKLFPTVPLPADRFTRIEMIRAALDERRSKFRRSGRHDPNELIALHGALRAETRAASANIKTVENLAMEEASWAR